ncbi:MAG TPA: acetyltransferase [Nitrososphaeraceae archaeon]|nr:acetyltransferase [Nitrososphaeraceae archaeon]
MKKKVIIFGMGNFAQIIYIYLKQSSEFEVVAFTVNEWAIKDNSNEFCNLPVVPFERVQDIYPPNNFQMFIALGYTNMNKKRAKIFDEAKSKGYVLISYVHPTTCINEEFHMGENCFIFENNVIQPFVSLGNDIIIWTGNVISHHTTIKDHCFIVSHCAMAGNVTIDSFCFIGMNATIRNGVKIAPECVIGAGSIILKDTEEKGVYTNKSTIKLDITSDQLKSL